MEQLQGLNAYRPSVDEQACIHHSQSSVMDGKFQCSRADDETSPVPTTRKPVIVTALPDPFLDDPVDSAPILASTEGFERRVDGED